MTRRSSPLHLDLDEGPRPVDLKLVELVLPELRLGLGMQEQNCHGRHASREAKTELLICVFNQAGGSSQ